MANLPTNDSGVHEDQAENGTSWHAGVSEYNPLPHVLPEGDNAAPLEVMGSSASDKLVIIMVGLPATGKTHIAKRICRFLSFFHDIPSQIFNVGDYRRQLCGAQKPASFYNPENADGVAQRKVACDAALADLMEYMTQDGVRVAALDATNSTRERRKHIMETLKKEKNNIKTIFVESICDDEAVSNFVLSTTLVALNVLPSHCCTVIDNETTKLTPTFPFFRKIADFDFQCAQGQA